MNASGETLRAIAFAGVRRLAEGPLAEVALAAKKAIDDGCDENVLVLDAVTSDMIEVDFRGDDAQMLARLARPSRQSPEPRGPGRPKLGVVAREVTLLPRHWEWLAAQPGGASVALRKLVEDARRSRVRDDERRRAREAAYKFMAAMAGDRVGFEEATRALFGNQRNKFERLVRRWPADVAAHLQTVAQGAFDP